MSRKSPVRFVAAVLAALGVTAVQQSAAQAPTDLSNWREVEAENLLIFDTTKGRIVIELAPDFAPNHVDRIRTITRDGNYDGTQFHRVIDDFMAQGGDTAKRIDDAGRPIEATDDYDMMTGEFTFERDPEALPVSLIGPPESASMGYVKGFPVETQSEFLLGLTDKTTLTTHMLHCPGVTSMARTNNPNSATDQFFLMRGVSEWLDASYTGWGRVLSGQDTVMAITVGEPRLVWRPGRNLSGISRVDPTTGQIYCLVEEPGQTVTITKRVLREPARVTATQVPPQFTTITKQVLVDPGGVEEVPVPPQFRTLTVQQLVRPADATPSMVPAQSRQIATNVVRAPERYEWVNVLCDTNATPQAISQLQGALQARGYYTGQVDGILGPQTASALERFQRDNGISHLGIITVETLRMLGIGGVVPSSISAAPAPTLMGGQPHGTQSHGGMSHSMSHSEVVRTTRAAPVLHSAGHGHGQPAPTGVTIHTPMTTQSAQTIDTTVNTVRDYSVRRQLTWNGKQN